MSIISYIKNKIEYKKTRRNSASYVKYLKDKGLRIGGGTIFRDPKSAIVDITRPSLVTIGENCCMNINFTLLTHDFTTRVFRNVGKRFINSSGRVTIGNNVSFGQNVMVLKGVTIGDNCFIGAGSIVTRDIPANSIAAGSPAKVIMTLDEYYQKRLQRSEEEALDYARSIQEKFNRRPRVEDFWEEFIWFVSGNEVDKYPTLPIKRQLGPTYDTYVATHKAKYKNLDEFLAAAGID